MMLTELWFPRTDEPGSNGGDDDDDDDDDDDNDNDNL